MKRLVSMLRGLFVPRPPPKALLTDPREFEDNERFLKYLEDELDAIRADKR